MVVRYDSCIPNCSIKFHIYFLENRNQFILKDAKRLEALNSYHILDTLEEKDYDDLTALAAAICGVPIALISLVDKDRQWFKSHRGLSARETPIDQSFCAHAIINTQEMMVVENANEDFRFKQNPLVTGDPNITFYAGVPLTNEDGYSLGTLCVIDSEPKILTPEQQSGLKIIAQQVMDKLELRRKIRLLSISESKLRAIITEAPIAIGLLSSSSLIIDTANDDLLNLWQEGRNIIGKPIGEINAAQKKLAILLYFNKFMNQGLSIQLRRCLLKLYT